MLSDYKKTVNFDMAMEARDALRGNANCELEGVKETVDHYDNAKVTTIEILNDTGAKLMCRGVGKYITIEVPELTTYNKASTGSDIIKITTKALKNLLDGKIFAKNNLTASGEQAKKPILIAGLGNTFTTPDSLGPEVISHIQPTAHLFHLFDEETRQHISPVSLFCPGVLGNTGIATYDTISGVTERIKPAAIIIIDALATRSIKRICNTIQITDTGIRPGSGICRNNKEINTENMHTPVIAIGVPTIMHAGTIINEAIECCLNNPQIYFNAKNENVILDTVEDLLEPYSGNLMVAPKEIDTMIPVCANIIATSIIRTVHPGLKDNEYREFMQ